MSAEEKRLLKIKNLRNKIINLFYEGEQEFGEDFTFFFYINNLANNESKVDLSTYSNIVELWDVDNLDKFCEMVELRSLEYDKYRYFKDLTKNKSKLSGFKVICVEDEGKPENPLPNTWVEKDRFYIVTDMKRTTDALCFSVIDAVTRESITPPEPYDGFRSSYFELVDYGKFN